MIFETPETHIARYKHTISIRSEQGNCEEAKGYRKRLAPLCQVTAFLLLGAISMNAMAQNADSSSISEPGLPSKAASENQNSTIKANGKPAAVKKDKYAGLTVIKGSVVQYPPPQYTVTGDNSFRQSLAEYGIGFVANSIMKLSQNTLGGSASSGPPRGTQNYNGQKFTYNTSGQALFLFDLQRYGIENGQVVAGIAAFKTNWEPAGPSMVTLATLSYYQTLFDGQVELKGGYINNAFEYYGPYVGGNLASAIFGTSATVPTQLGLSHIHRPKPGINIKLNAGDFYNKFGVQKSSSPDGYVQDHSDSPTGFDWNVPHAGTVFINELGYKKPYGPGQKESWFRAGYIRNDSDYIDYKNGGRGNGHYGYYFMADQQLYQFDAEGAPRRGVYGGFSIQHANEQYTAISDVYEARLYTIGPFALRPTDMASLVISRQDFSDDAVAAAESRGDKTHNGTWTFTAAYNAQLTTGIYAGLGLTYLNHPTPISYTSDTGEALTLNANLLFYW